MIKILTVDVVQSKALEIASLHGYTWDYRPTESIAEHQAQYVNWALESLYKEGYVNQKIKERTH